MDKTSEQAICNDEQHEDHVDSMDEETAAKEKLTSDLKRAKFTSVNPDDSDGKTNEDSEEDEASAEEKLTFDSNRVTFTPVNSGSKDDQNGKAKVDVHVSRGTVGMSAEELKKYANDPFWVRLRMILFVSFWIGWIGMLAATVLIIVSTPSCPRLEWYQKKAMYQVDVETFKDSNGDGIGDFKGLISKLSYLKDNYIGILLLSSFYESSDIDAITDHKNVDEKLGTLADFEELISELNKKDIKLIIDFNPNHSSDQHQWFIDSVEMKEPYRDFYVWSDTNNSLNGEGQSVWTYNEKREQYYLSTFGENRPDLNLREMKVREELKDILRFWLEKGVHGFKVVAASHLIEDAYMRGVLFGTEQSVTTTGYEELNHTYTVDNETVGLFAEWGDILTDFTESEELRKILLAEVYGPLKPYYKKDTQHLIDLYFNTNLTQISDKSTAFELKKIIDLESELPQDAWPTFLVGSKNAKRLASRVGEDLVDAIHMVTFIAKGTPITYYGDELGMEDLGSNEMLQSVMLWNNDTNAGFSNGSSTLKVHPDYKIINVKAQEKDKQSHLNIFKQLLALRSQPALGFGLQKYPVLTNETFSMIRVREGSSATAYLVVVNLGANSSVVDFTGTSKYLPKHGKVQIRSKNLISGPLTSNHPEVNRWPLKSVPLEPKQAVVFSFRPED